MTTSTTSRPFLKWAGGKYRLVKHLLPYFSTGKKLIEPFVGAGSVFLNTNYDRYLLCDINHDLINLYNNLKDNGDNFINDARELFNAKNNKENRYYEFRERFNHSLCQYEKSVLFLYLNRHGYNGLCRYSRHGFNVPFGRYKTPYFPANELKFFFEKAQSAQFICADFSKAMARARTGHTVYCDPPYVPLSKTAHFTQYSGNQFDFCDQTKLAQLAERLAKRNVTVIISNHDTKETRQLYSNAEQQKYLAVPRNISRDINSRKNAKEIIAIYR